MRVISSLRVALDFRIFNPFNRNDSTYEKLVVSKFIGA